MKKRINSRHVPVLLMVLLILVLTVFRINQSSVGLYNNTDSSGPSFGVDRPIRSDEWYVRLPWLSSQEKRNFAPEMVTAGSHDPAITYDMPTRNVDTIFRPHLVVYQIFDFGRAVAAEWWLLVIGSVIAIYYFLLALRIRPGFSLPIALIVSSSPGLHWWTVNSSFSIILYGCLGATAFLLSIRETPKHKRYLWAFVSGWLFACAVLVLYPPFQIPTLFAIGIILSIELIHALRNGTRREGLQAMAIASATFVVLTLWFIGRHRFGLQEMSNTVYPGDRRSIAGGVNVASLFGTPFDLSASKIVAGSVNHTNQSENSSTFLLSLPVLFLLPFSAHIGKSKKKLWELRISSLWLGVLVSWMLLPIPSLIGKITLLNRVPPDRVKPAIVFISALVFALFLENYREAITQSRRFTAVAIFGFITFWVGSQYIVNDVPISHQSIWLHGLVWIIPLFVVYCFKPQVGLWLLVSVSLFTSARINPIHNSVSALTNNSISQVIKERDPKLSSVWLTFTGTPQVRGIMVATGATVLSAVSPYPDQEFWDQFDPNSEFESAWNRYGHVNIVPTSGPTKITSSQADVIQIEVDLCGDGSPIKTGTLLLESAPDVFQCTEVLASTEYQGSNWFVLVKQ